MLGRRPWLVSSLASISIVASQPARSQSPTLPTPGKSLPIRGVPARVARSFPAPGIEAVILRAEAAGQAEIKTVPGGRMIVVSGAPAGDARGYHPSDPNWRETPAAEWGLDFAAKGFGPVLVISSKNEILYIHHYYRFETIAISVPSGVKVVKEARKLAGDGAPDLSGPAK